MEFKKKYNKVEREIQAYNIIRKYPNKIPIICYTTDRNSPKLPKYKYLVENNMSLISFMYFIRRLINLEESISLYFLINNKLCPGSELFISLYDTHKEDDGFLYINYACENTFGFKSIK